MRKAPLGIPVKFLVVIGVILCSLVWGLFTSIKSALHEPTVRPSRKTIPQQGPGAVVRTTDKVEDNVKQILSGRMLTNPADRKYGARSFMIMSSSKGPYYKDAAK